MGKKSAKEREVEIHEKIFAIDKPRQLRRGAKVNSDTYKRETLSPRELNKLGNLYTQLAEVRKESGNLGGVMEAYSHAGGYYQDSTKKAQVYETAAEYAEQIGNPKDSSGALISENLKREARRARNGGLEKVTTAVLAIAGLGAGIFFLSSNITGNAIADLSTNATSWVGGVLLIVGLVAGFFYLKSRKKKPVAKSKKK